MNNSTRQVLLPLLIAITVAGCSGRPPRPPSVTETSAARAELADRVRFIENYVTFRRKYVKLDYDVMYQNNGGGMIPGPSDWDIRLIAEVPPAEIDDWVPAGAEKIAVSEPEWLRELPGSIKRDGITEWYRKSGTIVAIDRTRSIVAYWNTTMPE
ncbi:MAG: hypothetical protein HC800_24075 [Phormidesmis sp. RL_2_1]|nr:hypothetical protein [Phormidesmis sp. RL_2_1]